MKRSNNRYVLIPLAWPDTSVSGVGEWYERFLIYIRVIKNPVYKFGHAAILIHNKETAEFNYYDFGRYETKLGFGRIRNAETDPELRLDTMRGKEISEVLKSLSSIHATHGDGQMFACEIPDVDSERLELLLEKYVNRKVYIYSPYRFFTLNCSRFVNAVVEETVSSRSKRLFLKLLPVKYLYTGTYVKFLSRLFDQDVIVQESTKEEHQLSQEEKSNLGREMRLKGYRLLEGVGSSAWFLLTQVGEERYRIEKTNEFGETTFNLVYSLTSNSNFDIETPFEFTYPSDALECHVIQNNKTYKFQKLQSLNHSYQSPKEMPTARAVSMR